MVNSLPNTTKNIHIYSARYDSIIPDIYYKNQMTKIDLVIGPWPNMTISEGEPNTIELAKEKNPDLVSLMYFHISGEPAGGAGYALPWGSTPDLSRIPFWEQINNYENAFFHAAEPSGLVALSGDGRVELTWMPDRRSVIPGWSVEGYNIYRNSVLLNGSPILGTSFIDQGLINGQQYEYVIRVLVEGNEIDYSWSVTATPAPWLDEILLYAPSIEIAPSISEDSFHPTPDSTASYTLYIKCVGCPPLVTCNFDGIDYEMAGVGNHYNLVISDKQIPASFYGGFQFHFKAESGSSTARLPAQNSFTTNINNRIRCRWWGSYLTNPSSIDLQNAHVSWINDWINRYHYDGIFYDLVGTSVYLTKPGADANPLDYEKNPTEFMSNFIAGKKQLLGFVKENIDAGHVFYNTYHMPDADYGEVTDGGLIESFVYQQNKKYHSEDMWKDQLNFLIDNDRRYNKAMIVLVKRVDYGDGDAGIQARMYSLASYLLGKGRKTYFQVWPIGSFWPIPEYFIEIGEPIQFYCDLEDFFDAAHGVFRRDYTNGIVLVNPSATETSAVIDLGAEYFQVIPDEAQTVNGGVLQYEEISSIELPPNTGEILLCHI